MINIKKIFLLVVGLALCNALGSNMVFAQTDDQFVILQYHHISTSTPALTSTSPQDFRLHMEYLRDNDFQVLALEVALTRLQQGLALPNKAAVITFDDNYHTVYTEAFPLLQAFNFPFTIFVTTGLVGSNEKLYANWPQLIEMAENSATIANHTISHPYLLEQLAGESRPDWRQRISDEITKAEADILEHTGQNHKILAYPYGEYNPEIQSLLEELEFIGVAQHSGPVNGDSDFTALPRFPFSGIYTSMNTFPTKVNSLAFSVTLESPASPITSESMPSAQLSFNSDDYRLNQLACYNNGESISVELLDKTQHRYLIESSINNKSRRFRYNCTAPSNSGRYYWYSILWVNPTIAE